MEIEKRWIRRVQRSAHEDSANQLVKHYYKEVFAFVYKQVVDEQTSLDLTQEIFVRMLQSITGFDTRKASFRTWLYRIASNHCVDYFRSKSYRTSVKTGYIEEEDLESAENILQQITQKEQVQELQASLALCDHTAQHIVRYKLYLDQTFAEIAVTLQLPESTIKTKYYKTIRFIRKEMEEKRYGKG
ncbi:RNA polymerase sigma factor [Planococcus sp. APC 3906]|uniref:RNA polymerase sigma factor n=1 Tax=Planococcus sp. APC 3906 TaxID=3035194 RepID=UPI0025B301D9|nr:RNA polymerase sigma factor [Planococcus sp. APC 3906]MDN3451690.1 RNA polymerase sigma factor [Planococcus sp. APC 3906]